MLTKRTDVDKLDPITPQEELEFIQVVNQKEGAAVENQRLLSAACLLGYPRMVKHLLNKTRADGSPVYTSQDVEDALSEIFDHGVLEKYKEYYPHQIYPLDTSEEGSKNRELCFRLIVSEVITDLQERRRINKEKIVEIIFNLRHGNSTPLHGYPLILKASDSSFNSSLISVFVDECDSKNIDFKTIWFNPDYGRRFGTPLAAAGKEDVMNYKMLEVYLREYLKMQYEGKENDGLYPDILNFFDSEQDHIGIFGSNMFARKMRALPEQLALALKNAESDLREKHGDNFDKTKLTKITNNFEAKFTPDAHKVQMNLRNERFVTALTTSAGIITIPFVWAWYLYHRLKEPIEARDTSVQAYAQYASKANKEHPLQNPTRLEILERVATKEPVIEIKDPSSKKVEWKTHKVVQTVRDDNDKIRVFSSRYNDQAKKFDKKIKEAEEEVNNEGPKSPMP